MNCFHIVSFLLNADIEEFLCWVSGLSIPASINGLSALIFQLNIDGWKTTFPFRMAYLSGTVVVSESVPVSQVAGLICVISDCFFLDFFVHPQSSIHSVLFQYVHELSIND